MGSHILHCIPWLRPAPPCRRCMSINPPAFARAAGLSEQQQVLFSQRFGTMPYFAL